MCHGDAAQMAPAAQMAAKGAAMARREEGPGPPWLDFSQEPCAEPPPRASSSEGERPRSPDGAGSRPPSDVGSPVSAQSSAGGRKEGLQVPLFGLEEELEQDYSQHLAAKGSQQMCKYSVVGIGLGGALGLVASPFVVPAVAVGALLAGGASGLQLARRKQKSERLRVPRGDVMPQMVSSRPSLRRLKFLVQWGHLKLLEYEDQSPEWNAQVLDDVIMAFSPWVQEVYVRKARCNASAEVKESAVHLLPLYSFMQRTVCSMALVKSAEITAAAFEDGAEGGADLSACLARCRVGFPTVLQTIATVEQLNLAIRSKTIGGLQIGRQRLQRVAAALRAALLRPAVHKALAAGAPPAARAAVGLARASAQEAKKASEEDDASPSRPEAPPEEGSEEEGSEEEGSCGEEDYFSCSEDAPERRSSRSVSRRLLGGGGSAAAAAEGLRRRTEAFQRGDGEHTWSAFDSEHFPVRSITYLLDRMKEPSRPALFHLAHIDCIRIGESGPVHRVSELPAFYPAACRRSGDRRFLLVLNLTIGPYQAILCGVADPDAWKLSPEASELFRRFLEMTLEERKARLKLIASIEDGPWLLRRLLPNTKKPVIVGKAVPMESWHAPGDYLEISLDVAAGKRFEAAVSVVMKQASRVIMSLAFLLEGQTQSELPEALLLAGLCTGLDVSRIPFAEGA